MIKKREEKSANYRGIWFNGKTIRIALNPNEPITELEYPEFYDVDIFETGNGLCKAKCPWCYLSAKTDGRIVEDAVDKIKAYFGAMNENQRPFQVAMPGSGEFFEHPDWEDILKAFHDLGIEPNYTTNGMWSLDESFEVNDVMNATSAYCGGVAVSCHPHLRKYWEEAARMYYEERIKLNFHIIISDRESIDYFKDIYNTWKDKVDYFVLLPYGIQGRAEDKNIEWEYLVQNLPENQSKLAFGANFHSYLSNNGHGIKVSLYEPEIMSKFLALDGSGALYNSSFDIRKPIKTNLF